MISRRDLDGVEVGLPGDVVPVKLAPAEEIQADDAVPARPPARGASAGRLTRRRTPADTAARAAQARAHLNMMIHSATTKSVPTLFLSECQ